MCVVVNECGLLKGDKIQEPNKEKIQYLTLANIRLKQPERTSNNRKHFFRSKTHLLGA